LLLFIIFLIYRKLRLTKKRLDYELNDVRNMANVSEYNNNNNNNSINNEKIAKNISMDLMNIKEAKGNKLSKYSTLSE
jgi:hypothetical protein